MPELNTPGRAAGALALFAAAVLATCDDPQPPGPCGTVPEQTIHVGESVTVNVCFSDPNEEDLLTFATTSSNPGVATVGGTSSAVTVTAISPGTALVTVTATDPGGLKAQQSFRVVVPNRPPAIVGTIGNRELFVGDTATLDVSAYFSEPDGQTLTYGAASGNPSRLTASAQGTVVVLTAIAKGNVTVTVTATDPGGLMALQSFQVTIPNRAPVAMDSVPARTIEVDQADTLDMSPFFADPDGDTLSYTVAVSDNRRLAASVVGNTIILAALAKGETVVVITATDNEGLSATHTFPVTVPNRPPVVTDSIPARTVYTHEADTLELARFFVDPDGDPLRWGAETSDDGAVAAVVSRVRGTLRIAGIMPGDAEVSVTASDSEGLEARQSFRVVVPNRPPAAVGTIADRELMVGETAVFDVAVHFGEPDGQPLTYAATSADSTRLTASVQGTTATLVAIARGSVTATLTATDPGGLTATHRFQVVIPNRPPVALDAIPDRTIEVDQADTLDVHPFFADPDGDTLAYTVAASDSIRLAASVVGSTVTMIALAKGETVVAVTATDSEGASAVQTFRVTVPNRPPTVGETIQPQTLFRNEADTRRLLPHFTDPDGDPLTFSATVTDSSVVTVTVSRAGGTLTVTAVSQGAAEVTATATDDEGLSAQQTFVVTVPNRAPSATGPISAQSLFKRDSVRFDLTPRFTDPDGDPLTYTAATTDASVATAGIEGTRLTIRTMAAGEAAITVTATDPGGMQAQQSFLVTVENRPPAVIDPIPDQTLHERTSATLGMSPHFEDADGDPLTYTASTSNNRVATVTVSRSFLTVRGVLTGEAEITVTATDPDGASASHTFAVTVERPIMNFDIGVGFASSVTASQERVFRSAVSYWESALRLTEFSDVAVNETLPCPIREISVDVDVGTIDDIGIIFLVADLDGEGGTGAVARLCYIRSASRTPLLGVTVFDRADIDRIAQAGNLREIAIHEIAHVLGFGLGPWLRGGLLRNPSEIDPDADTHFSGTRAVAAFNAAGGSDYSGAKVPVENGGDDSHWRESVLGHELMTPTATLGASNPPSAITLQSFADLGYYVVDASHAESYRLPEPAVAADIAAAAEEGVEVLSYENDVEHGPIRVLDSNGRVVDVIGEDAAIQENTGPVIRVILREER